ncbi:MAG: SEC-C domain-containing protein [Bdellovibrionales bacterium]|nr:SEC-C domain-containing protein [Bdellovibrionales bacterium]
MTEKITGRNEPCPCGSGKKYKRCHGAADEAPKAKPAMPAGFAGMAPEGGMPAGFDPSQLDMGAVAEMQKAMKRLPKGQLMRIQALMQKAMSGKDVSREAAELERVLPPQLLQQMMALSGGMPGMPAPGGEAEAGPDLSVDDARRIVEKAVAEGKVSAEEAERLLAGGSAAAAPGAGLGGLWKRFTGKK